MPTWTLVFFCLKFSTWQQLQTKVVSHFQSETTKPQKWKTANETPSNKSQHNTLNHLCQRWGRLQYTSCTFALTLFLHNTFSVRYQHGFQHILIKLCMYMLMCLNVLEDKSLTLTWERLDLLYPEKTKPHPPLPWGCNSWYLASNSAVIKIKQINEPLGKSMITMFSLQIKITLHYAWT